MKTQVRDRSRFLVYTVSAGMIVAILLLAGVMSIAGAQTEPDKPPFNGRLVESLDGQETASAATIAANGLGPEWRTIFQENFENEDWDSDWYINADLSKNPTLSLMWGTRQIGNSLDESSSYSAWAIGGGANGSGLSLINPSYPKGVNSWLVAGPFDFTNAEDILVDLDLFYEANKGDRFSIAASENLLDDDFVIQKEVNKTVNQGSWESTQASLSTYIGKPTVYIAFTFSTANPSPDKIGALMDNVKIWVKGEPGTYLPMVAYGFTPTPPPVTPTVTPPPPGGDYKDDFTDNIDGWLDRRSTLGTAFSLTHDSTSVDESRSGFLNFLVNTGDSHYVIASPLVQAKAVPYNIETFVKLRSERETGDQYGIVFGGNFDPAGGDCRAPNIGVCFTQYYEMRVRFYYDDQADKDRMEMKLKRIDSVDENNNSQGPDLIEWTRVSGVEEDKFIEWDITYSSSGQISISADKNPVGSATDTTYMNNPYFGVIVRTEDKADSEARYDYIKVD